ncbi:RNA-binding protein [Tepidiforma sp.]|uniref:RNA-binding protein n=1 Tax=Tepidiforma sp. TaxID=2682230 RepID=UPI002ADDD92E|nr:RNA-binding protein [Tepidiforma sp.]
MPCCHRAARVAYTAPPGNAPAGTPRESSRLLDLFIGNLSYLTTEDDLAELLRPFGLIGRPRLAYHPRTGLPRGHAIATLASPASACAAMAALNGRELHGRYLFVRESRAGE